MPCIGGQSVPLSLCDAIDRVKKPISRAKRCSLKRKRARESCALELSKPYAVNKAASCVAFSPLLRQNAQHGSPPISKCRQAEANPYLTMNVARSSQK